MSTLWTPEGEHEVPRDRDDRPEPNAAPQGVGGVGPDGEEITAEQLAEMAQLEQELLEVPVADVVANHVYGLFQLAALHLAQRPARLDDARLVIDALGAIVETLGPRLGQSAPTLTEALSSVRLAYVEIAKAQSAAADATTPGVEAND